MCHLAKCLPYFSFNLGKMSFVQAATPPPFSNGPCAIIIKHQTNIVTNIVGNDTMILSIAFAIFIIYFYRFVSGLSQHVSVLTIPLVFFRFSCSVFRFFFRSMFERFLLSLNVCRFLFWIIIVWAFVYTRPAQMQEWIENTKHKTQNLN